MNHFYYNNNDGFANRGQYILMGLLQIIDGIVQVLPLGFISSDFSYRYTMFLAKEQARKLAESE